MSLHICAGSPEPLLLYNVIRPDKTIPVFRVTQPYLNLQVKPRIFFRFFGKNIILCILKGEMPFKMHKIIFFSRKNKYVCLPYLKFSYPLPGTHLLFYLPLVAKHKCCLNYTDVFLISGIPEYNCHINVEKVLTNFKYKNTRVGPISSVEGRLIDIRIFTIPFLTTPKNLAEII